MKLENQTILVTGATSGIGLAFATRLLAMNNQVIIAGHSAANLADTLASHPGMKGVVVDMGNPDDVERMVRDLSRDYPDLSIVLNSAGIMRQFDLFDQSISLTDLTAEVQTNLKGTIFLTKAILPLLNRQPEAMIVNMSSVLSLMSGADSPVHSASKAGIHMYTDALREQVRAHHANIYVLEMIPSLVSGTKVIGQYGNTLSSRMIRTTLDKVVNAGIKGMERNRSHVDVGFTKLLRQFMKVMPNQITHIWGQSTLKIFLDRRANQK
ncbi:SDR family oxidoreductase [Lactobacillus sp. CBA3605]|uniref:SDR family oxidoreductase n=1 Tax=Lactobacillus sp. CBA3605 TaxID=2099788 RepID=UPI001319BBFA|nr:SDR family NAD(P)-dependent oxidoreductase [Lactobacillus sp. CBA3605]